MTESAGTIVQTIVAFGPIVVAPVLTVLVIHELNTGASFSFGILVLTSIVFVQNRFVIFQELENFVNK